MQDLSWLPGHYTPSESWPQVLSAGLRVFFASEARLFFGGHAGDRRGVSIPRLFLACRFLVGPRVPGSPLYAVCSPSCPSPGAPHSAFLSSPPSSFSSGVNHGYRAFDRGGGVFPTLWSFHHSRGVTGRLRSQVVFRAAICASPSHPSAPLPRCALCSDRPLSGPFHSPVFKRITHKADFEFHTRFSGLPSSTLFLSKGNLCFFSESSFFQTVLCRCGQPQL